MSEGDFKGTTRWLCPRCERAWCDGIPALSDHMLLCRGPIVVPPDGFYGMGLGSAVMFTCPMCHWVTAYDMRWPGLLCAACGHRLRPGRAENEPGANDRSHDPDQGTGT